MGVGKWGGLVGAVVVVGAVSAPVADAAPARPAGPGWAPAATAAIRPGVHTVTAGGGTCTADFLFSAVVGGTPRTYLGQAAHCGGTGPETVTDGCTAPTVGLGTPVTITAADGGTRTGTLAYSSWVAMQQVRETDAATCAYNDFALVELDPADAGDANPSVPSLGGPTGLATRGAAVGETVYGCGGAGLAGLVPRTGRVRAERGGGRNHLVGSLQPGVPGDSGCGYLTSGGAALGVLATLDLAQAGNGVADLAHALAYADAHGGLGPVALVPGTEPFTGAA